MKLFILALCSSSALCFAQAPRVQPIQPGRPFAPQNFPEVSQPLPENYVLTLSFNNKDQQANELVLVVASADFAADMVDPTVSFSGTLALEESGSVLLRYTLGTEVPVPGQTFPTPTPGGPPSAFQQIRTSSAKASVRLKIGEPLVILKSGTRQYRLMVSRLSDQMKKTQ